MGWPVGLEISVPHDADLRSLHSLYFLPTTESGSDVAVWHLPIYNRNVRLDVTAWTGWQRSHHCHPLLTRQKRCFYKGQSLTWAHIFVVHSNIRNLLGYFKRGNISLPNDISQMKIYWQIKEKLQVILKFSTKSCIMLRRLPLVLPTSGPIPLVLGCGLTSHFGDSKIPIVNLMHLLSIK